MRLSLAAIFLSAVIGAALVVRAQEPAPPVPEVTPAPTVITVNDAPAAVAPAPADSKRSDVQAVADQATDTLKDVASGDVSIEQATRDPAETPDPGANYVILLVSTIAAAGVRWALDALTKRVPEHVLPDVATSVVGHAVTAAVFVGAWAVLHSSFPDLPQTWQTWLGIGLAGSAAGGAGRSAMGWQQQRKAEKTGSFIPPLAGQRNP